MTALLFVSAIGFAFLIGASESVVQCEQREERADPAQRIRDMDVHWVSRHCDWVYLGENDKPLIVLATLGLFGVTAGLTVYTARLWGATNRLARDGRKATRLNVAEMKRTADATVELAKHSERVARVELRAYINGGVGAPHGIVLKNTGKTPAHGVRFLANVYHGPRSWWNPAPLTDPGNQSVTVLAAGDSQGTEITEPTMTPTDIAQIATGDPEIIGIVGSVTYFDVFNERCTTDFKLFSEGANIRKVYTFTPEGNSYT